MDKSLTTTKKMVNYHDEMIDHREKIIDYRKNYKYHIDNINMM